MSGDLIVRVYFFGLLALEPGTADEGMALLLDSSYLLKSGKPSCDQHYPYLHSCEGPDCSSIFGRSLENLEMEIAWIPKPGAKIPNTSLKVPPSGEPPSDDEGFPQDPGSAADFRWAVDFRNLKSGTVLRSCRLRRKATPCDISSVITFRHGTLSTCQLVDHSARGWPTYVDLVRIYDEQGDIVFSRAAASAIRLEMRLSRNLAEGVGLKFRTLGKHNLPISEHKVFKGAGCSSASGDDRCVDILISNQPIENGKSEESPHFKAFKRLATNFSEIPDFKPVADNYTNPYQPSCSERLNGLIQDIEKRCESEPAGTGCSSYNLGNRAICPLVRF